MRHEPEPLASAHGLSLDVRLTSFVPVLGDSRGDCVVQAAVQGAKIICANGGVHFHGEGGNGLTDVAVALHHLSHGALLKEKLVSVESGAPANLWICR
jgi:hypothetical protein